MGKVIIIGGGAAGMFCGVHAGRAGHQVHIYEKNETDICISTYFDHDNDGRHATDILRRHIS